MSFLATAARHTTTTSTTLLRTTTPHRLFLRAMSSGTGAAPNFKGFPAREPSTDERQFLDDVLQLYRLNPISSAYARYDQKAVFSDPVSIAEGLESVKAQFKWVLPGEETILLRKADRRRPFSCLVACLPSFRSPTRRR